MALGGFVGGLIFGLLVAWGVIGLLGAGIGIVILVIGSIVPTLWRAMFSLAILGFLISWIVSGGLSVL